MSVAEALPIFHLSLPVNDLDEAVHFYENVLGGVRGRRTAEWADVALFGAQLTLQNRAQDVLDPMPRSGHFGATLSAQAWERLIARLSDFVEPPATAHAGTEREQRKAMIADPSGNHIELKTYRDPHAVLGDMGRS